MKLRADVYGALMHIHDILDDRQSDTGAAGLTGTRVIHAEEPVEKVLNILLRHTHAVIRHFDTNPVSDGGYTYINCVRLCLSVVLHVLNGVGQKVDYDSHDEILASEYQRIVHILGDLDVNLIASRILRN